MRISVPRDPVWSQYNPLSDLTATETHTTYTAAGTAHTHTHFIHYRQKAEEKRGEEKRGEEEGGEERRREEERRLEERGEEERREEERRRCLFQLVRMHPLLRPTVREMGSCQARYKTRVCPCTCPTEKTGTSIPHSWS